MRWGGPRAAGGGFKRDFGLDAGRARDTNGCETCTCAKSTDGDALPNPCHGECGYLLLLFKPSTPPVLCASKDTVSFRVARVLPRSQALLLPGLSTCIMPCQFGEATDQNGCGQCKCNNASHAANPCYGKGVVLGLRCENGRDTDVSGPFKIACSLQPSRHIHTRHDARTGAWCVVLVCRKAYLRLMFPT